MEKFTGLDDEKIKENRKKYGTNDVEKQSGNSFITLFIEALNDPIIKILLISLAIKTIFLFRDFNWFETIGILIAIFFASFISSVSEFGSQKAFLKMQEEASKLKCRVKRNNKITEIFINEVVKDDIVILESGDKVPADGIIIKGNVSVDESSISGESKEVNKYPLLNSNIKNNQNMLYKGTVIYSGTCIMLVTKVGKNTLYGKIADELREKNVVSPLNIRLRKLAKIISTIGYVGAGLASFSYLFSVIVIDNNYVLSNIISTITNFHLMMNYIIYALTLSVTIIIVSVPEGLPMMITLVLSSNMKRMVKSNVLVRKMVGIETAGNINILFSDKTGTLTTGKLHCIKIIDGDLKDYKEEKDIINNKYKKILKTSMLVNNLSRYDNDNIIGGNATDKAILSFFKPCKYDGVKIIKQIPFDSKNKYMITVINDEPRNLIKGAPEIIVDNCKYYYDKNGNKKIFTNKNDMKSLINKYTNQGTRVIALAVSDSINEKLFRNLTFVGIVLIHDEIRKEATNGIDLVKKAGVQTIMITGDNENTASYIAKKIGLISSFNDIVITSNDLNKLSDEEIKRKLPNIKVVARSLPQDKSRLVKISQEMGLVVGMTGDGVNDAPALKKADVGFAFGSGSEVAKEASDIVLLNNNFLSISNAILYGRTIFKSIRKFIIFQLTINLCALLISIIGPFIGIDTPVTVVQMLWINMVMDTLAGLAFSFEPPLIEYMEEKPKKKTEGIINLYMVSEIIFTGLYTTVLFVLFLKLPVIRLIFTNNESFMTAFFALFIFCGIFNMFNSHTSRINILSNLIKNKMFILIVFIIVVVQIILIYYGGDMFRCVPLTLKEFIIMIILSFTVVPIDILRKIIYKKIGMERTI